MQTQMRLLPQSDQGHHVSYSDKRFVNSSPDNQHLIWEYSKTCLKQPLKKNTKNGFQYQLSLNAGQKYFRMLQGEHSAILSTFIKLPFVFKTLVLSIFVGQLKTGFTVEKKSIQNLRTITVISF